MESINVPITAVTEEQLSRVISELYVGDGETGEDFDFQLKKLMARIPSVHIEGQLPVSTAAEKFYAGAEEDFSTSVRHVSAAAFQLELKSPPASRSHNVAHAHVTAFKLPPTHYLNLGNDLLEASREIYTLGRGLFEVTPGQVYAFYDTSYGRPSV